MAERIPRAVYAAMISNIAVAIIKFAVAYITHSSAMTAEGIHSLVDTGNGILIVLGIHQSRRPADKGHPFGYGLELYFWTFIVALIIFGVGGGMSIFEGITHILRPVSLEKPMWGYAVLAMVALLEGYSWRVAWQGFKAARMGDFGIIETMERSKDPPTFMILIEDTAALIGVAIAFLGIVLSQVFHTPLFDGLASILIGIVLCIVAGFLARESKGLLLGESADPRIVNGIRDIVRAEPVVELMCDPITMHFGPNQILLNLDVQFRPDLSSLDLESCIARLETRIKKAFPTIKRIFVEANSIIRPRTNPSLPLVPGDSGGSSH